MIYSEQMETSMRAENGRLVQQLRELRMDLEDATKSRRQLQHRLQDVEGRMGFASLDNNQLKVQPIGLPLVPKHCD